MTRDEEADMIAGVILSTEDDDSPFSLRAYCYDEAMTSRVGRLIRRTTQDHGRYLRACWSNGEPGFHEFTTDIKKMKRHSTTHYVFTVRGLMDTLLQLLAYINYIDNTRATRANLQHALAAVSELEFIS